MQLKRITIALLLVAAAPVWAADLVSICDVQQYNGISEGDLVRIEGVVVADSGRYGSGVTVVAQEGGGPWCFVAVYDASISWPGDNGEEPCTQGANYAKRFSATMGQCLMAEGVVTEYYDATEVKMFCEPEDNQTLAWSLSEDCFPIPDPLHVPTGEIMNEQYEWVLVEARCATVSEAPDEFGVFQIDDGSGPCNVVGSYSWEEFDPQLGDFFCRIAGVQDFSWGRFRVRPRTMELDIDMTTPQDECTYCAGTEPTPTPTAGELLLDLEINQTNCFTAGDTFYLTCVLTNTGQATSISLAVVLDLSSIGAGYYFWPTWGTTLDYQNMTVDPGEETVEILNFPWPGGAGSSGGARYPFIAAAFEPDQFYAETLIAGPDQVSFCFE